MKHLPRLWLTALAIATGYLAAPVVSLAQSTPGLTIFSDIPRENQLGYFLDFGGRPSNRDRYRLRIPSSKIDIGVSEFTISYSNNFSGVIDPNAIEVYVRGQSIPLERINWDQAARRIQIFPKNVIEAGSSVEIQLSNVINPQYGGMFNFEGFITSRGDLPLARYVGTWTISIGGI